MIVPEPMDDPVQMMPVEPQLPPSALRTSGLTKRYGNLFAVSDVSLDVPLGSTFGLIGPNGAGKSTTFAMIAALVKPTSGSIEVAGINPVAHPQEVRRRIGYMPDVLGVYDKLTVFEYLEFFASAYSIPSKEWPDLVGGLLELVDLDVKAATMVDDLSRGMKQRLSLARALVHDPEVLILDEPASGLDPRARVQMRDLMVQLREMGKTVIISSHILVELQEVCSEVAILEAGRLLAQGPPRQILERLGAQRQVRVRLADGSEKMFSVAGDEDQAALLHRLIVDEGLRVTEFTPVGGDLESVFMQITKGIVQ